MAIANETIIEMYKRMYLARLFEDKIAWYFSRGMVHGTTHLSVGQEASGVAASMALKEGDLVSATHRGHSQVIGFGLDINKMAAELLGKVTGYCKGKGGSMHIADIENGNLGANGIVGGGFSISVGAALTQQYKKTGNGVLCFAGDGAANEGSFHESLNLASVWKLPVIFFIENNLYGMSTPIEEHMNIRDIADRAKSYGIPGIVVDGNNAVEVYETVSKALEYVKNGKGPVLIESKTYRWVGHSKSDAQVYRTKEEVEKWKEKDPIKRMRQFIIENEILTDEEVDTAEEETQEKLDNAAAFAENSEEPSTESVNEDVYA